MVYIVLSSAYLSSILLSLGISGISYKKQKRMLEKDGYQYNLDKSFLIEVKNSFPASLIVFLPLTNILVSSLILKDLKKNYDIELEELLDKNIIKYVDDNVKKDNIKAKRFKNK